MVCASMFVVSVVWHDTRDRPVTPWRHTISQSEMSLNFMRDITLGWIRNGLDTQTLIGFMTKRFIDSQQDKSFLNKKKYVLLFFLLLFFYVMQRKSCNCLEDICIYTYERKEIVRAEGLDKTKSPLAYITNIISVVLPRDITRGLRTPGTDFITCRGTVEWNVEWLVYLPLVWSLFELTERVQCEVNLVRCVAHTKRWICRRLYISYVCLCVCVTGCGNVLTWQILLPLLRSSVLCIFTYTYIHTHVYLYHVASRTLYIYACYILYDRSLRITPYNNSFAFIICYSLSSYLLFFPTFAFRKYYISPFFFYSAYQNIVIR